VILGTAAYMSPEQARGKAVDKRTDIWAFGCVLYELLTGKQAFAGDDITDILAAVVRAEPDWHALPPATATKIRDLLRRCLQKDKTMRMQAAGDARIELQEALSTPLTASSATAVPRQSFRRWALISGLVCLVVAAIVGVSVWNLKPTSARPVTRTVINLPPGDQLAALDYPAIAISPDGTQLAYVAIHSGTRQIYLRGLDNLEPKPLEGTEGANSPFFSPDGQWLGFFAGNHLKKISVKAGAALVLANIAYPRGGSWGDGTIVFTPNAASSIQKVSDVGGTPQRLTRIEQGEVAHSWPELLPGGQHVLFATTSGIVVQSLPSGERKKLAPGGTSPRYAASGHLLSAEGGKLLAAPFDARRLELTGAAAAVLDSVLELSAGNYGTQYSISATGSLVYVPGGAQAAAERLVWVSRNGAEQALAAPPHNYVFPRISPDGRRVAVGISEEDTQLWLYDFGRDTLTRLTFDGISSQPTWTPDGKRIAFVSNKEEAANIFWQLADGSRGVERLTTSENAQFPRSFSPDGQLLAFTEINPITGPDIWVLRLSDRKAEPFLRTPFTETVPSFSPDGHWLAYVSNESGRDEVYMQPYPGPGGKWQISTEGGTEPVWNPNGKELFYRSEDKMMSVDIIAQPSFSVGRPRMLFQGPYLPGVVFPYYDVSPDAQRFLMIKPSEQTSSSLTQIVVVQNWFEELRRRVPTGK
jgi:Tol biopolymer transport system component